MSYDVKYRAAHLVADLGLIRQISKQGHDWQLATVPSPSLGHQPSAALTPRAPSSRASTRPTGGAGRRRARPAPCGTFCSGTAGRMSCLGGNRFVSLFIAKQVGSSGRGQYFVDIEIIRVAFKYKEFIL